MVNWSSRHVTEVTNGDVDARVGAGEHELARGFARYLFSRTINSMCAAS